MQQLVRRIRHGARSVEVWVTSCVVVSPPPRCDCLVVPANERLCGSQFPYFAVGAPTPEAEYIGEPPSGRPKSAMGFAGGDRGLYQCESIDGLVTEYGGHELRMAIASVPSVTADVRYPVRCPTGEARRTKAGALHSIFPAGLVHAVAPFWSDKQWAKTIAKAYAAAFAEAFRHPPATALAVPLLGAGARGAPAAAAAEAAARAADAWLEAAGSDDELLAYSFLEDEVAEHFARSLLATSKNTSGSCYREDSRGDKARKASVWARTSSSADPSAAARLLLLHAATRAESQALRRTTRRLRADEAVTLSHVLAGNSVLSRTRDATVCLSLWKLRATWCAARVWRTGATHVEYRLRTTRVLRGSLWS